MSESAKDSRVKGKSDSSAAKNSSGKSDDTASVSSKISESVTIWCTFDSQSCRKFWCKFNSYWRLLGLLMGVVVYLVIGGVIFSAVEGPNERRQIEMVQEERQIAFDDLTARVMAMTNLSLEEARNVTIGFIALGEAASRSIPAEQNPVWDYSSAFFFASTVITTIGYGSISPSTAAGQVIFIFYAIFGIPLALVFLSQIGSVIDKFIHAALKPVKRKHGATVARTAGLIGLIVVIVIFFILIPAGIFSAIETWNYRESVYYAVVSLTTVGFGDFVPATAGTRAESLVIRMYSVFSSAWLWIGLALVSALIGEFQSLIEATSKWFRTHNCCCCCCSTKKLRKDTELESYPVEKSDH